MLVAAGIGLARYQQLDVEQRLLLLLTLLALLMEAVARTVGLLHQNNLFLAPLDTAIEFTLLALIYRRALYPSRLIRVIPWLMGAFLVGTALSFTPRFDVAEFNPGQHTAEAVLVLMLVSSYLYREIVRQLNASPLERSPMFWVSAGALLYFAGNLLIFLTSNYVLHLSRELSMQVWAVHGLLYTMLNVLYAVALACPPRGSVVGVTQS